MNSPSFSPRPKRRRYSAEEREAMVQKARAMRASGMSLAAVASELGVSVMSLTKWLRDARPAPSFLPVRIAEAPSPSLSLVTPSGYRVEGLTPEGIVALLRILG